MEQAHNIPKIRIQETTTPGLPEVNKKKNDHTLGLAVANEGKLPSGQIPHRRKT